MRYSPSTPADFPQQTIKIILIFCGDIIVLFYAELKQSVYSFLTIMLNRLISGDKLFFIRQNQKLIYLHNSSARIYHAIQSCVSVDVLPQIRDVIYSVFHPFVLSTDNVSIFVVYFFLFFFNFLLTNGACAVLQQPIPRDLAPMKARRKSSGKPDWNLPVNRTRLLSACADVVSDPLIYATFIRKSRRFSRVNPVVELSARSNEKSVDSSLEQIPIIIK